MQNERFRVNLNIPRRQRACISCRQRKRKCDGNRPTCSGCIALGRASECQYGQPSELERSLASKVSELEKLLELATINKIKTPDISDSPRSMFSVASGSGLGGRISSTDPRWWELDEIPSEMSAFLMTTFTRHASQFHFDQMMPSFLLRLNQYSPAHPSHPHASLLNAIYLIASFYLSSPSFPTQLKRGLSFDPAHAESIFLKRTRMALSDNLAVAANLLDFLHASGLLGRYLYYLMRHREGHHEIAGAVQIAMACNLHKISSATDLDAFPPSLLPPPADTSELLERINSFWFIYIIDQMGGVVSGLPASFPDEGVTTVFPPPVEDPSAEEMYRYQPGTAATLLEAGSTVAFSTHDTLHGLKAKGTALMRKVRCLSVSSAYHGPKTLADMPLSFTMDYYIVTNALDQFITSLPPVPSKASSTSITSYGSALAELALPATVCRAGLMQLCWMISGEDEEAHKKMLNLGNEIVDITRMVEKVNEIWWQVPIQMAWGNTCEVYQQEIVRLLQSDSPVDIYGIPKEIAIDNMRKDMKFFAGMTRRLMKVYRAHHSSLDFIEGVLAMDIDISKQFPSMTPSSSEDPSDAASSTSAIMEETEAPPLKWIEWLGRPRPSGSRQAEKKALKNMQRAWKLPQLH